MELLRDELQAFDEQTNVDKFKIEQYLTLLEEQIVRSNQLHEEELENLRRDYLSLLHKQDLSKHRSSSAFSS